VISEDGAKGLSAFSKRSTLTGQRSWMLLDLSGSTQKKRGAMIEAARKVD